MIRKACVVAVSAALLSGCFGPHQSQAPVASSYPLTHQQKMQAAHHWDVLAEHEARQIAASQHLRTQPMYIQGAEGYATPFNEAFESLLTSQLINHGAHLSTNEYSDLTLSYKVQVVRHADRGFLRAAEGAWTTLAAGIAVATIPYNRWSEPALALIPAAAAVDLFSGGWVGRSTREVIITTQATDGDRVVYSSSNIYYVNAGDSDHYNPGARQIKMTETW